ncbi:MAG: hypothetical protein HUU21_04915, partial [Polyangiaceae bacterium]|nr:hypothetical protein [Polyangiaceae bacterium]
AARPAAANPFGAAPAPTAPAANNPFAAGSPMASFPSANMNPYTSPSARGMAAGGQAAGGGGPLDVGDVMDRSWKIFTANLGQLILGMFLYIVVVMVAVFGSMLIMGIGGGIAGALADAGNDEIGVAVMVISMVLFAVALFALTSWMVVGLFRWILGVARGEPGGVGLIFSGGPYLLPAMGAGLLFTLATMLGYLACIVPGLFVALIFSQFLWLILDRNAGPLDSLSQSMRLTEGNRMSLFLLGLIAMGISLVGGFIPFSFLFTGPFIYLMMAVAYLRMTGQTTADMLQNRPMAMGMPPQ